MPASYFDLDGTLLRTNLIHPTLFYMLRQQTPLQSLVRIARAAARAPQMALAEMRDRKLFNEVLFSTYEGISADRLRILARDLFTTVIKPGLYPYARDLIRRARSQGEIVLISGGLDLWIEPLAQHLGVDDFIANRLEFRLDRATGKLIHPVVAGPEKARLIREHAGARGYDLADCFAYSDSSSDIPMLSLVGHPVAVNPDAKLTRIAHSYGWPVIQLASSPSLS